MSLITADRMAAKGARNGGGSGHGPGRRGVLSFKLKFNTTSRYDAHYFNFNSPHTSSIKLRSRFFASCQRQLHAETPDSDSWGLEQLLG